MIVKTLTWYTCIHGIQYTVYMYTWYTIYIYSVYWQANQASRSALSDQTLNHYSLSINIRGFCTNGLKKLPLGFHVSWAVVVRGWRELESSVLQFDHRIIGQISNHRRGVQVGEEEVFGGWVLDHIVPVLVKVLLRLTTVNNCRGTIFLILKHYGKLIHYKWNYYKLVELLNFKTTILAYCRTRNCVWDFIYPTKKRTSSAWVVALVLSSTNFFLLLKCSGRKCSLSFISSRTTSGFVKPKNSGPDQRLLVLTSNRSRILLAAALAEDSIT